MPAFPRPTRRQLLQTTLAGLLTSAFATTHAP